MYFKYYPSAPFFTMRETHSLKIKNCRDNPKNPFSEGFMADGLECYRFSHCLKSGSRIKVVLHPPLAEGEEAFVSTDRVPDFRQWLNR